MQNHRLFVRTCPGTRVPLAGLALFTLLLSVEPLAAEGNCPTSPIPGPCTCILQELFPEEVMPGESFIANWQIRNCSSSVTVTSSFPIKRVSGSPGFGPVQLPSLEEPLFPGEVAFVGGAMGAPFDAGFYTVDYQFHTPADARFGEPMTVAVTVVASGGVDDAETVEEDPPDGQVVVVQPGERFTKRWRIRNTGTTIWDGGDYFIARDDGPAPEDLHPDDVPIVAPGGDFEVEAEFRGPQEAGTHRTEFDLIRAGEGSFHEFDVRFQVPEIRCISATRVFFPDGLEVFAGQSFFMRWELTNCGTVPFGPSTGFRAVQIGSDPFQPSEFQLPQDFEPGETGTVTPEITAPVAPGTYLLEYRVRSGAIDLPGSSLTLPVTVLPLLDLDVTPDHIGVNAEGWPTPNPLTIEVSANCPFSDQGCTGLLGLEIRSAGDRARFRIVEADLVGSCDGSIDAASMRSYLTSCGVNTPDHLNRFRWVLWIQPGDTAALEVTAFWRGEQRTESTSIEQSRIHPLIFLPDMFTTKSPDNQAFLDDFGTFEDKVDSLTGDYASLSRNLEELGYEWGRTLFSTSYDWRQSHEVSAVFLDDLIERFVLPRVDQLGLDLSYVNKDRTVDLLAHGTGGLIARSYIQGSAYENDVREVAFFGTPHRGFPAAYRAWNLEWSNFFNNWSGTVSRIVEVQNMNRTVWPSLVRAAYEPTEADLQADCHVSPLDDGPSPVLLILGPGFQLWRCDGDALAKWTQSPRGAPALTEILPAHDLLPPFLFDGGTSFPFGQPLNDFLFALNQGIGAVRDRLGAENIYNVYGVGQFETDESYLVTNRGSRDLWRFGEVTGGFYGLHESLGSNATIRENTAGDDLLTDRGSCLDCESVFNGSRLLDLPAGNEVRLGDGGLPSGFHRRLVSSPEAAQLIARFLAGYSSTPLSARFLDARASRLAAADLAANDAPADRLLSVVSQGPVQVLVTDFSGRRLGYDRPNGQIYTEIPGSSYSGPESDPQLLLVPNPESGDWMLSIFALEPGRPYLVLVELTDGGGARQLALVFGETDPAQPMNEIFEVDPPDPATPSIEVSQPAPVMEAGDAPVEVAVTVRLSAPLERELAILTATSDGTALASSGVFPPDYAAASGTLVFAPGETEKELLLQVLPDVIDEPSEDFSVHLFNPFAPEDLKSVSIEILDDDPPPAASVQGATVLEQDGEAVGAAVPVTLSLPSAFPIEISYRTSDGTAISGADYTGGEGRLTFEPGQSRAEIPVTVLSDDLPEGIERFTVAIFAPVNAVLEVTEAVVTIVDDDLGLSLDGAKEGGLAWCDFNGDGFLDLVANTGVDLPGARSRIFFSAGDGSFTDVTFTHAAGLARRVAARSAVCGDLNDDGYVDLVRNGPDRIEIYLNRGPLAGRPWSFGDPGQDPSQVIDSLPEGLNPEGLGLLDWDNDGDLDLAADNHDSGIELFRNDGEGCFTHATPSKSPRGLPGRAISGDYLAVADFDDDGRVDLLARKQDADDLFRNRGSSFRSVPSFGEKARNSNKGGVAFCDFDSDGDFDAVWTDAGETQIWRNRSGIFEPTGEPGASSGVDLGAEDLDGVACADLDNDGDLDLFFGAASGPSHRFLNQTPRGEDATLAFLRDNGGIDLQANAEAVAFADYDRDGDLDLAVNVDGAPNQIWQGTANDAGENRYLAVRALRCIGGAYRAYRDDIGATVRLFDGETPVGPIQEVNGGQGHGSQAPAVLHFGLPLGADHLYTVRVRFKGRKGKPGKIVEQNVLPAQIAGYQLAEVKECADENLAPIAYEGAASTAFEEPVEIDLVALDPEGRPLAYDVLTPPGSGSLEPLAGARYRYRPAIGFSGRDELLFAASDGVLASEPARISIQVLPPPQSEAALAAGLDTFGPKEGGLAWCDFDQDGFFDLLVNASEQSHLYLNQRNGTFADVTATHAAGLMLRPAPRSAICGDLDHDGYLDFARNASGRIEVYRNRGPLATPPWSFGDENQGPNQTLWDLEDGANTEGMAFIDFDRDGDLDLVADNHEDGLVLLENRDSILEARSRRGLPRSSENGDYLAAADYDADGDVDVVARKKGQRDLWRNEKSRFSPVSSFDEEARNVNKGGVAFCDFDADGDFDLLWTDAGTTQIWRNHSGDLSPTGEPGASSGMDLRAEDIDGVACADVDLDSDMDVFLGAASGPSYLFINDSLPGSESALRFTRHNLGIDAAADVEGAVFADMDRDGDPDLLLNIDGGPNQLWKGTANDAGSNDYLAVRLLGCVGEGRVRDLLGATARLFDGDGTTPLGPVQEVNGGSGHGSQSGLVLHFGLPFGPEHPYHLVAQLPRKSGRPETLRIPVTPGALGGYQLLEVMDPATCEE